MFIIIGFNDVALQLHRQGKRNMIEEFALQHKILEAYKKKKKKGKECLPYKLDFPLYFC